MAAAILLAGVTATASAAMGTVPHPVVTSGWVGSVGGGDGTTWTDPANWQPQGVPSDGDSAVIAAQGATCQIDVVGVPDGTSLSRLSLNETDGCQARISDGAITITRSLDWGSGRLDSDTILATGSRTVLSGSSDRGATALTVSGTLKLVQATVTVDGASGLDVAQGGHLEGSGTITGTVLNSGGTVSPGSAIPGGPNLSVTGDYTQLAGATVQFHLEGAFDALGVGGTASIKGRVLYHNTHSFSEPPYHVRQLLIFAHGLIWKPSCRMTNGPFHQDGHWIAIHGYDARGRTGS